MKKLFIFILIIALSWFAGRYVKYRYKEKLRSTYKQGFNHGKISAYTDFQSDECWVDSQTMDVECIVYIP